MGYGIKVRCVYNIIIVTHNYSTSAFELGYHYNFNHVGYFIFFCVLCPFNYNFMMKCMVCLMQSTV